MQNFTTPSLAQRLAVSNRDLALQQPVSQYFSQQELVQFEALKENGPPPSAVPWPRLPLQGGRFSASCTPDGATWRTWCPRKPPADVHAGTREPASTQRRGGIQPIDSTQGQQAGHKLQDGDVTLVMRNIPAGYTQEQLMRELGCANEVNLFHLPASGEGHQNLGYAISHFKNPTFAKAFQQRWQGQTLKHSWQSRKLQVRRSKTQGLGPTLAGLKNYGGQIFLAP
mmetsp:Transcript_57761/g.179399  ORF Transcript_57761/g.179399 Transcript_57761/m.179399 type:complete len:226 (+) Transcript_57761:103-780(+)